MAQETFAFASINQRCEPIDRGEIYEDPLDDFLQENKLGEVCGGGTSLSSEGDIESIGIDITIHGDVEAAVEKIIAKLEELGAPKGSVLQVEEKKYEFGKAGCILLQLSIAALEALNDMDAVQDANDGLHQALGEAGACTYSAPSGAWYNAYFYGPSAEQIEKTIREFTAGNPVYKDSQLSICY